MKNRIVSLDLVRAFSCICILVVHFNAQISGWNGTFVYPNSITANYFLEERLYLGEIGVSLFFILSGATLMLTYKDGNLWEYYKKRFLNIFPMFWLVYIATTIIDFFIYKGLPSGDLKMLVFSVIGMDGYLLAMGKVLTNFYKVGEWFLGCILCLYLVFPLVHWGLKKNSVLTIFLVWTGYAAFICYMRYAGNAFSNVIFFLKIPELLIGMLFVKYDMRNNLKKLFCITGVTAVLLYCLRNWVNNATLCTAVCMFIFAILICIGEKIKEYKATEYISRFAELTYPIFLIHHWLILRLINGFDLANIQRRNVYFMFTVYILLTFYISCVVKKANKEIIHRVSNIIRCCSGKT